jgi:hypothetical protein
VSLLLLQLLWSERNEWLAVCLPLLLYLLLYLLLCAELVTRLVGLNAIGYGEKGRATGLFAALCETSREGIECLVIYFVIIGGGQGRLYGVFWVGVGNNTVGDTN